GDRPGARRVMAAYETVSSCDLVHDHALLGPVDSERYPDLPVVTTIHNQLDEEHRDLYRRVDDRVWTIAVSHAQRKPAPELRIARVIHHGIDASAFTLGSGDGAYL